MNPNKPDIDDNLLLQYLLGNTDESSREEIERWLNADSGHRDHLDLLESLWVESGKLSPVPVAVDVDAAWLKMSERITRHEKEMADVRPETKTVRMRPLRAMFAAAAVVLLLAGIFTIYTLITRVPDRMEFVSAGAVVHDTLPDGTRITLNGKSKLTCPESFDDHYRETDLTGEAFFEVTHDPAHPFIVHAGSADIRVLGTSFVVKSSGNRTEVSVSEGRVRFYRIIPGTADTTAVVLEAGDHGVWQNGVPDPVITENIAPDVHFWANGSLEFRHTPLSDVFSLVERYYQVKISVSDPSILHCRLTASFVKEPADRMLGVIAESFGLTLVNNGQVFHFTGNGCSQENN